MVGPICNALGFAIYLQKNITSPVSALLVACCPSAIIFAVRAIIVFSINTHSFRGRDLLVHGLHNGWQE